MNCAWLTCVAGPFRHCENNRAAAKRHTRPNRRPDKERSMRQCDCGPPDDEHILFSLKDDSSLAAGGSARSFTFGLGRTLALS